MPGPDQNQKLGVNPQAAPAPPAPSVVSTPEVTVPPVAPSLPAWEPKLGQTVLYTEINDRTKALNVFPFVITAIGLTTAPKKDDKGIPVKETVNVKTTLKGIIPVTRVVMEDVANYDGVYFSANQQFPVSKRGVLIGSLAPVEV
jgi:hypothetical protein